MNDLSARLLDILQNDFPAEPRPFLKISRELGIEEEEVIERIRKLKEDGYIRRLGGVFNSKKLGYVGTLCAMQVPTDRIHEVSQVVNAFPEVTHNYIRTHDFNMWFTITAPSEKRILEIMEDIATRTKIKNMIQLNSLRFFKLKVQFDLGGKSHER